MLADTVERAYRHWAYGPPSRVALSGLVAFCDVSKLLFGWEA